MMADKLVDLWVAMRVERLVVLMAVLLVDVLVDWKADMLGQQRVVMRAAVMVD